MVEPMCLRRTKHCRDIKTFNFMSLHLSQRLRGIRETCFWAAALLFAGPEPAAKDSPPATGAGGSED